MTRYILFLALTLGAGCGPKDSGTSEVLEPWGGLKVHLTGAPVLDAATVVVLLHGYGAPGDDLVALSDMIQSPSSTAFVFPEAPITLDSGGLAWNRLGGVGFDASRQRVLGLLEHICRNNPTCRLVVGGFSQGGTMASNLLSEKNPQIAGILLYSPRNEMTHTPVSTGALPKIFLSHGKRDGVIPFSSGQALKKRLEGLGYGVTWVGFDGGHNITQDVLAQTGVFLTLIQEESGRLETR